MLGGHYAKLDAAAPNARVVVVGYPQLFDLTYYTSCNLVNYEEMEMLNELTKDFNTVLRAKADGAGFMFYDPNDAYQTEHRICGDEESINGIVAWTSSGSSTCEQWPARIL